VKLVDDGDISAMVKATRSLLGDAPERHRVGVAGLTLYDEHFDLRHVIAALCESATHPVPIPV
jgi:hypothetical protein